MNTTEIAEKTPVAELLNRLLSVEQEQAELAVKHRQAKAELYKAKNELEAEDPTIRDRERKVRKEEIRALNRVRYATNNGLTIHKLRQAGNTVSVVHIRYADIPGVAIAPPVPSYLRGAYEFLPRGGATYVTIIKPNGEWMSLSSVCHIDDSFDYKLGVKHALEQLDQQEADALLVTDQTEAKAE
jgi:hypothetical protein